jgi:transposase
MKSYPKELRVRVVAAVEQGEHSTSEIASLFGVGFTFIKKMMRLHRAGADLAPRQGGGPEPSLKEPELEFLREQVANQPDVSLDELREALIRGRKVSVSLATISRALKELGLPRKKRAFSPKSAMKSVAASSDV